MRNALSSPLISPLSPLSPPSAILFTSIPYYGVYKRCRGASLSGITMNGDAHIRLVSRDTVQEPNQEFQERYSPLQPFAESQSNGGVTAHEIPRNCAENCRADTTLKIADTPRSKVLRTLNPGCSRLCNWGLSSKREASPFWTVFELWHVICG